MIKGEKRSVGRPKLADTKLKKKSLIMLACCFVVVIVLLLVGGYKLNIINFNKLGGTVYKDYQMGEEFCLGTECFEVIGDDGEVVTALAKYNLLIGYQCPTNHSYISDCTEIPEDTEGYGYQSDQALGLDNRENGMSIGMVKFSDTAYWGDNTYNTYVYDQRTPLYDEIQSYQTKLRDFGYSSVIAQMVSYNQVQHIKNAGANFYSRTTYWTGSAHDSRTMYAVCGTNICNGENTYPNSLGYGGLRPVIRIAKEDFAEEIEITEDGYYRGKEICLDDECFYVISYTDDTVTALAKYGLNVTSYEQDDINPTPAPFSINNYWADITEYPANVYNENSIAYTAVSNYEHKLHDAGFTTISASLLNYNQAVELGCDPDGGRRGCENSQFPWLYSINYWLGTAGNSDEVLGISSDADFGSESPNNFSEIYIRPVITIDKSNIYTKEEVSDEDRKFTYGDEYCFEDECFNVINQTDDKIRLLAKYNLLIGKNYTLDSNNNVIEEESLEDNERYGLQSADAKGKIVGNNKLTAVVPFSNRAYWWNNNTNQVKAKYLKNLSSIGINESYGYVFDEENIGFAEEVANYKEYLSSIIKDYNVEIELVDYLDMFDIYFGGVIQIVSTTTPYWYEDTGYWTGVADGEDEIMTMSHVKSTGQIFNTQEYNEYNGVRVVITLTEKEPEPEPEPETTTTTTTTTTTLAPVEKTVVKIIPSGTQTIIKTVQKIVNGTNYVDKKITTQVVTTKENTISFAKKVSNIHISDEDDAIFFIVACVILSILLTTLVVVLHNRKKESSVK